MTYQTTFAHAEFAAKKKTTRREKFLARMEEVIPWARLLAVIEPHYPQGKRGRPPIGLERMLRVYFLQQWYGLADEALEDALYDILPALTSPPKARRHHAAPPPASADDLCKGFAAINADLRRARPAAAREGTLVDATLIAAPSSTKNAQKQRDPEMHQTRKGNQWYG